LFSLSPFPFSPAQDLVMHGNTFFST